MPTPDIKERIEEALMRMPRGIVRKRFNLLPSELDDYDGEEEAVERNPISGY